MPLLTLIYKEKFYVSLILCDDLFKTTSGSTEQCEQNVINGNNNNTVFNNIAVKNMRILFMTFLNCKGLEKGKRGVAFHKHFFTELLLRDMMYEVVSERSKEADNKYIVVVMR